MTALVQRPGPDLQTFFPKEKQKRRLRHLEYPSKNSLQLLWDKPFKQGWRDFQITERGKTKYPPEKKCRRKTKIRQQVLIKETQRGSSQLGVWIPVKQGLKEISLIFVRRLKFFRPAYSWSIATLWYDEQHSVSCISYSINYHHWRIFAWFLLI